MRPAYTVGILIGRDHQTGDTYVLDIVRDRGTPGEIERLVRRTAERDTTAVTIILEEEGGSAGKVLLHHYRTHVLSEYAVRAERPTGDKTTRAQPAASKAEAGTLHIVHGPWTDELLDELELFPHGRHDDQVDALTQGTNWLAAHHQTPLGPLNWDWVNELTRPSPFGGDTWTNHGYW